MTRNITAETTCQEDIKKCIEIAKEYQQGKEVCIVTLTECRDMLKQNNITIDELEKEKNSSVWQGRKEGCIFGGGLIGILGTILLIALLL